MKRDKEYRIENKLFSDICAFSCADLKLCFSSFGKNIVINLKAKINVNYINQSVRTAQ
jgi:hypothetical protein